MAGLAVVVAVLAGCSEPEQPSTTLPTATSTSAAAATLEPLGPADFPVPDEAREQTEAGAIAMATYYLDLIDFSRTSLDADLFLQLSDGCETCNQLGEGYQSDKEAGNTQQGGDLAVADVGPVVLEGDTADLTLRMTQAPVQVAGPDGQVIPAYSTGELRLSGGMVLTWNASRVAWIVSQLNAEQY